MIFFSSVVCREPEPLEPIPLLDYEWGQSLGSVEKKLERQLGLSGTDKMIYYFGRR